MRIRNKALLATGAALALSVSMVAATLGTASATTPPPDPARHCTISNLNVTFASPGISKYGSLTPPTVKTSTTTTTAGNYNCGGAGNTTGTALSITSKDTAKCDKKVVGQQDNKGSTPTSNPNCTASTPKWNVYGTAIGFAGGGTSTLQKAVKKVTITIGGVTYLSKTTGVVAQSPLLPASQHQCGTETGFVITGTVAKPKQDKGQTFTEKACLLHDTGPGTTNDFGADIVTALGSTSITIATTSLDSATSTLDIS
jgi:hypothetical protein